MIVRLRLYLSLRTKNQKEIVAGIDHRWMSCPPLPPEGGTVLRNPTAAFGRNKKMIVRLRLYLSLRTKNQNEIVAGIDHRWMSLTSGEIHAVLPDQSNIPNPVRV
jgi:hypothetical protein